MKKLVVLSGAGISAESGIPTFRDINGLWENHKVEDVATIEGYQRNQKLVIDFYNTMRKNVQDIQPNLAHQIIGELEDDFEVVVITQNVDDLHEKAGSSTVVHLHGEINKVCSSFEPNNPAYIKTLSKDNLEVKIGDLAEDGSQLRPYIVWFGEEVHSIALACEEVYTADIFLIIGTSLNVYPAASLIDYVSTDCKVYLIDPNADKMNVLWNDRNIQINKIAKKATEGMVEFKEIIKTL